MLFRSARRRNPPRRRAAGTRLHATGTHPAVAPPEPTLPSRNGVPGARASTEGAGTRGGMRKLERRATPCGGRGPHRRLPSSVACLCRGRRDYLPWTRWLTSTASRGLAPRCLHKVWMHHLLLRSVCYSRVICNVVAYMLGGRSF